MKRIAVALATSLLNGAPEGRLRSAMRTLLTLDEKAGIEVRCLERSALQKRLF